MGRQYSSPYLIRGGESHRLSGPARSWNENELQEFLYEHPDILPVTEIEPIFNDLVPVCRELSTPAGPADIAYINGNGMLTIVECKLWQNADARRRVVGQILDYAKELAKWDYPTLTAAAARARKEPSFDLHKHVTQNTETLDEADFVDSVTRNLRNGTFLLFIVGDGIRENVVTMTSFLQQHAHLNFCFALVEIALHDIPERAGNGTLVQPRVLARTVEIERSVVRIEGTTVTAMPGPTNPDPEPAPRRTTITEETFYRVLKERPDIEGEALRALISEAHEIDLEPFFGSTSLMLKYVGAEHTFNFIVFRNDGTFQNSGIALTTAQAGQPEIGEQYLEGLAKLIGGEVRRVAGDSTKSRFHWTVRKHGHPAATADLLAHKDGWLDLIRNAVEAIKRIEAG